MKKKNQVKNKWTHLPISPNFKKDLTDKEFEKRHDKAIKETKKQVL